MIEINISCEKHFYTLKDRIMERCGGENDPPDNDFRTKNHPNTTCGFESTRIGKIAQRVMEQWYSTRAKDTACHTP